MTDDEKVLAVDVCGTLYDANTTAGLVIFHHARCANRWRSSVLEAVSAPQSALRFGLVAFAKLTGWDLHRAIILASLRGERLTALEASATRYVEDHLSGLAIQPPHERMQAMRKAGWTPVLVSNAISPVVAAIAQSLDVPFIASRRAHDKGRLTGRLQDDLTGRKRAALERFLKVRLDREHFAVITDNKSDGDLVAIAKPALLVATGHPKNWMREWDAEIIFH